MATKPAASTPKKGKAKPKLEKHELILDLMAKNNYQEAMNHLQRLISEKKKAKEENKQKQESDDADALAKMLTQMMTLAKKKKSEAKVVQNAPKVVEKAPKPSASGGSQGSARGNYPNMGNHNPSAVLQPPPQLYALYPRGPPPPYQHLPPVPPQYNQPYPPAPPMAHIYPAYGYPPPPPSEVLPPPMQPPMLPLQPPQNVEINVNMPSGSSSTGAKKKKKKNKKTQQQQQVVVEPPPAYDPVPPIGSVLFQRDGHPMKGKPVLGRGVASTPTQFKKAIVHKRAPDAKLKSSEDAGGNESDSSTSSAEFLPIPSKKTSSMPAEPQVGMDAKLEELKKTIMAYFKKE